MKSDTDEKYEILDRFLEEDNPPDHLKEIVDRLKRIDWFSQYREELWAARKRGHRTTVILLLNIFFEAYLYDLLKEYYRENGLEGDELFFLQEMSHNDVLDKCRDFDLVSENNYRILKELNTARNQYAHELENWAPVNSTQIEEQEEVEEAVQLHLDVLTEGTEQLCES